MEDKPILYFSYQSLHSQKVLMYFYEKGVDFNSYVIDDENGENHCSWYLRINPRGELPTLEVDDKFISGSEEIIDYVEDKEFGRKSLIFKSTKDPESKIDSIKKRLIAIPIEQLTIGTAYFPQYRTNDVPPFNSESFRSWMILYNKTRCERLRMASKTNSGTTAEAILLAKAFEYTGKTRKYADEEEYQKVLKQILSLLEEIESNLAIQFCKGKERNYPMMYLDGQTLTVADCLLAVILHRIAWLGYSNYIIKDKPLLTSWWKLMQKRESFQKSTKISVFNIPVLKRKICEHKFKIITVLGLLAAFAFGYSYRSNKCDHPTIKRFIILEKLW